MQGHTQQEIKCQLLQALPVQSQVENLYKRCERHLLDILGEDWARPGVGSEGAQDPVG